MELIERYLQEVGRYLPANQKADILSELRSSLTDTLEARGIDETDEAAVIQVIKEMGAPRKVAASYYPESQYLIGPELYPFFMFILGIVFAASIGGQLIAAVVTFAILQQPVSMLEQFSQIAGSIPAALGMVVLVFAILQRLNVQPKWDEQEFDPRKLPALEKDRPIKRGEQVISIILALIFLGFLSQIAATGGFTAKFGVDVFTNPVLDQYFPWIAISMVLGILLDIVLLWRGHWEVSTRIAKIGANVFGMVVLSLLIQGHNAWLGNAGLKGLLDGLTQLPENAELAAQIIGMTAFRISFYVAFIVTAIETLAMIYRLFRAGQQPPDVMQPNRLASINQHK